MSETDTIPVYSAQQLARHVPMSTSALEAVERAFRWLAEGLASMPPVMHIEVGRRGDVDIKSAYIEGEDRFAVKIASGFIENPRRGLPSGSGLMVVLSAQTGFCEAILLDQGYLTDLRTGLAGAVAAKYLAPETVTTVGVVGSGVQARFQVEALRLVRDFERVLVWARHAQHGTAYLDDMTRRLGRGVEVELTPDLGRLVRESQCVVTTTPSREPLLRAEWLHPGLHITAMGSDLPGKQELEAEVLRRADLLVCDAVSQATRLGELQHVSPERAGAAIELGETTIGRHSGRTSDDQITVCDLTGVGAQDTAIALFALEQFARDQAG